MGIIGTILCPALNFFIDIIRLAQLDNSPKR
jgi:hypothetical protein